MAKYETKFRKGDRVIIIKEGPTDKGILGKVGLIEETGSRVPYITIDGRLTALSEDKLEHEAIYNSPLYKALS